MSSATNLISFWCAVRNFHIAFSLHQPSKRLEIIEAMQNADLMSLRLRLILASVNAFEEDKRTHNRLGMLKELLDVTYRAYGTGISLGTLPIPDPQRNDNPEACNLGVQGIMTLFQELSNGSEIAPADLLHNKAYLLRQNLIMLINGAYTLTQSLALCTDENFDTAFMEVHRSNMSKLDAKGKPIYRADGKVLKSELYSAANLLPYLAA